MHNINCPVCGSYVSTVYLTGHDRLHGIPGCFTLSRCACDTLYLNPMPEDEELIVYYPDDYLPHRPFRGHETLWHRRYFKRWLLRWFYGCPLGNGVPPRWARKLVWPLAWMLSKSTMKSMIPWHSRGRILDVGCGNGGWLLRLKAVGWSVQGVDIDDPATHLAHQAGVPAHCGTITDAQFPDNSFDVIRFHYVFEHITDPAETLQEVKRIMEKDGLCYIRVPTIDSFTFKLFKEYWFPLDVPRHVIHYTPRSMVRLAQNHGLRVSSMKFRSPSSGFFTSIDYMQKENAAPWYLRWIKGDHRFMQYLWIPFGLLIDLLGKGDIVLYTLVHDTSVTQKVPNTP